MKPRPNELWRHRDNGLEFRVGRLARRSAFGAMTIPGAGLTFTTQLLYSQLDAKWERIACPRKRLAA